MDSRLSAGLQGSGSIARDSGAFNDLNRLSQFKVGGDTAQNIEKVAKEFESLFVNEMLKSMRSANAVLAEGNFLNSNESKTYQDMHDQQLAVTLSKEGRGIGLADVLVRQMSKVREPSSRPNPFAQIEQPVERQALGSVAAPTGFREVDDVAAINRRRLAVPGKMTDRLLAGIVPSAAEGKPLVDIDWSPNGQAEPNVRVAGSANLEAMSGRRIAQPPLAPGKAAFSSPQDFVATMMPMAQEAAEKIGVDPSYLVAQAALETGWGKSIIRNHDGQSSHNLFGIKAHGWDGGSARVMTTEFKGGQAVKEAASFRTYDSFAHSFNDYVQFLQENGRYKKALASNGNSERFVKELQSAGYATDPQYARKISQIARKMQTYQAIAAVDVDSKRT